MNITMLEYLQTRRSVKAKDMVAPAPDENELKILLQAAMRVPDHGKLSPWSIKVLNRAGQEALGDVFAKEFQAHNPQAEEKHWQFERDRAMRAPLLLAVLYTPKFGKIPEWEQQLSAGALCMNIIHAMQGSGYAAQWLTEWPAFNDTVKHALGGGADDRIAGFIYIGSATHVPEERPRPDYNEVVSEWAGA